MKEKRRLKKTASAPNFDGCNIHMKKKGFQILAVPKFYFKYIFYLYFSDVKRTAQIHYFIRSVYSTSSLLLKRLTKVHLFLKKSYRIKRVKKMTT